MQELFEILQYEWAIRALIASSMVGLMCGILGCFIVLRNMSLIGDALAHAILPGVVFAFMIVGYSALGFFTGAVLAGLAAALGITWIQQNVNTKNDAAIGIVFTAMFSIGVMGISWISRNDGVHLDLKDFLFGNVLGVSNQDLFLTAAVLIYVIVSVIVFYRYLFVSTFQPVVAQTMGISVKFIHYFLMLLLSFAVVASLQTVGVILVVAMLITPASTALLLSNHLRTVIFISALIGFASAVLGLIFAILLDTTPGPAMAVTATLIYLLAVIAAPNKGLIFRWINKRKLQRRIHLEDILKRALKLQEKGSLTMNQLVEALTINEKRTKQYLQILRKRGLFEAKQLQLTTSGIEAAKKLVRAHRLWETYLSNKIGLDAGQIHEEAERYEHFLSEELLDKVDEALGFPSVDPHGSPIPTKVGFPDFPMTHLEVLQKAKIAPKQISEKITVHLWKLGLLPETLFLVQRKEKDVLEIQYEDKSLKLPLELARKINTEKV